MKFTKRTYIVARRRAIDRIVAAQPSSEEFEKSFNLGVRIVNRGRRERGLWRL